MTNMPFGSLVYALLWVRKMDLSKVPTQALEHAFVFSAICYEDGAIGTLPDDIWDGIGLELLARKDKCSIDFHMAVNWDVLTMKATRLAIDFEADICKDAERCKDMLLTISGLRTISERRT